MTQARRADKRRFPRRAKSIRFRFDHADDRHFAVSTMVSIGGAYLKASHLPPVQTALTLVERFKADGGHVTIRCEVVWHQDRPTLERPETGFGVRFIEAVTRADPANLEEFLIGLDPNIQAPHIALEERAQGVYSVYRFPSSSDRMDDDEPDFTSQDEPDIVDLAGELERLRREEAGKRTTTPVAPPTTEPPALPQPMTRKRRRITGLFTALFSRQREGDGESDNPAAGSPEDRRKVEVVWEDAIAMARIQTFDAAGATLWLDAVAPVAGTSAVVRPTSDVPPTMADLYLMAQVVSREDRPDGVILLTLQFTRIDERGRAGRFADYLRYLGGA